MTTLRLRQALESDLALRTGVSAALVSGWDELASHTEPSWVLDAYLPLDAFSALQEQLNELDLDGSAADDSEIVDPVLLRVVDEPWPFPPNYPITPQPLAALDLFDYPRPGRPALRLRDVERARRDEAAGPSAAFGQSACTDGPAH